MGCRVKKHLTRDDVIRAGACVDGVYEWADEFAKNVTALPTKIALRLVSDEDRIHLIIDVFNNPNGNTLLKD